MRTAAIHLSEFDFPTFLEAAKQGRIEVLREQLQGCVHIDEPDADGLTALWWAVYYGHFTAAELLLKMVRAPVLPIIRAGKSCICLQRVIIAMA
nr:ankyrin repeat domain-containing protein [uncultured Deefgea sp.]